MHISGNTTKSSIVSSYLRAETISNTTLLIQWDQPVAPNGIIRNYTLIINYGGSTIDRISVDGQLRMYLLDGLSIYQSVQISIAARTDAGMGPAANYITANVQQTMASPTLLSLEKSTNLLSVTNHQTTSHLVWTPPSNTIYTVKYYHLTLHTVQLSKLINKWTLRPNQVFNITLTLNPYVPYRLDALLMTDGRGTGMISSDVFFTKEGAPTAYPSISSAVRAQPNEGRIYWSPLDLWDSQGVVKSYTISIAQSSSNETCGNTINTKTVVIVSSSETQGLSHSLNSLNVQSPYCIKIQASTSSGPGPFSPSVLLPTYASTKICVLLSGVYNCSKWILEDLNEKISNATVAVVNSLNQACSCSITTSHLVQSSLTCNSRRIDGSALFCTTVIGTSKTSSQRLRDLLIERLPRNSLLLSGLNLNVSNVCETEDCAPLGTTGQTGENDEDFFKVFSVILSIVLGLFLLLEIFTCVLLANYCNKYHSKKSNQ
ncbi:PREDICTED: receptor-type tyrosine-protein phosphatase delta-like [Amphimedon queenslandica]|uniref:Fibronectin type-III domain-containing protein n=1 Tax=Amphimedon queenslandica TaxID=400682 RepID=A0AAN0K045_AMPQE|nr:PREDICTED: receptor-type tyrosine-protein phosphatase delta-like [Amphimedon queenslandica]|eukprot:XP_019862538.1 PREDICTED: receptor-type tyrosine-protein phosphatase delta-like [Amphimedon queenslandica]